MATAKKQVLIIDNATTCAMRIKTLVNIHGATAKILHWSDWGHYRTFEQTSSPCVVIVEETVPQYVVTSVLEYLADQPLFLLINQRSQAQTWPFDKPVTPIASSLSNFELMALLEPYWSEEKALTLPSVLVLDDDPQWSFLISESLSKANIASQVSNRVQSRCLNTVDMVLVNISSWEKRVRQIKKIRQSKHKIGVIAYGSEQSLTELAFVQFALEYRVDMAMTFAELSQSWLAGFYRVWRDNAELQDKQLVAQQVEASLATLLEKNLLMQVLFANSMDGVVAFTADGEIVKFNNGFCELVGIGTEAMKQSHFYQWLVPQSKVQVQNLIGSEHFIQQQIVELSLLHQHKLTIPVSTAVNKINFHGKFIYVAVMRNTTSQELEKKILVQENAQLLYQNKVKQQQFSVERSLAKQSERKKKAFMLYFTDYVMANINSQSELIQRQVANIRQYLLTQTEQEPCVPERITLLSAINQALTGFAAAIKQHKLRLEINVSSAVTLVCDPDHIHKVLIELIDNAIKYSVTGGEILFSCAINSEQEVELILMDTGMGILEHKQICLFDLYELNSCQSKQLSTGLPLVKALLQKNHGRIYVDNHQVKEDIVGSIFKIVLPS